MELASGQDQALPQTAVGVDPQSLKAHAAVRLASATRDTPLAIEVGFDGAAVAGLKPHDVRSDLENLHTQFVTQNPGVREERLTASVGIEIGAAYADATNGDQHLTGTGTLGLRCIDQLQAAGRFQEDCPHRLTTGTFAHDPEVVAMGASWVTAS
jgi:hypothetical protein